jgi:tetratricopeptide (TPR) repeat protein
MIERTRVILLLALITIAFSAGAEESFQEGSPSKDSTDREGEQRSATASSRTGERATLGLSYSPDINHEVTLAAAREMSAEGRYLSAFRALYELEAQNGRTLRELVHIATNYYASTLSHEVFGFLDLDPGVSLSTVREEGGEFELFYPKFLENLDALVNRFPNRSSLALALADYLYAGWSLFGDGWILPAQEAENRWFELYDAALNVGASDLQAYVRTGEYLLRAGSHAEAVSRLGAALEVEPSNPRANYNRAYGLIQLGRAGEAIEHAALAGRNYTDADQSYDAWLMAGRLAIDNRRIEEALIYLERASERRPGAWEADGYRIDAHLVSGNGEAAAEAATELVERFASSPGSIQLVFDKYRTWNAFDFFVPLAASWEAAGAAEEALGLILFYRGFAEVSLGREDRGRASLTRARQVLAQVYPADHVLFDHIERLVGPSSENG